MTAGVAGPCGTVTAARGATTARRRTEPASRWLEPLPLRPARRLGAGRAVKLCSRHARSAPGPGHVSPFPRTNWTRLVLPPVLSGHVSVRACPWPAGPCGTCGSGGRREVEGQAFS